MPLAILGEAKSQDPGDNARCQHTCRIPRLNARRPGGNSKSASEYKNKAEASLLHRPRYKARPVSGEKGAPPMHRKIQNKSSHETSINPRQIITVPVKQKFQSKNTNRNQGPNKEIIKRYENLEVKENFSDDSPIYNDMDEIFLDIKVEESIASKNDEVMQLKNFWQENIVQYERMKNELNKRQSTAQRYVLYTKYFVYNDALIFKRFNTFSIDLEEHIFQLIQEGAKILKAILEVYSSLRNTKEKLTSLGQNANLPSTDDLRIMNVANMTPNQLLQLCAETKYNIDKKRSSKNALTVDMKKLNDMPTKLLAVCEQTLATRKQFIEWLENLKNHEKACHRSTLTKKINEFNAETEMVNSSIQNIKNEFLKEISEFLRTCWNETMAYQQRNEELSNQLKELNSENLSLKKKISNYKQQKMQINKLKMEELSKELKEEKEKAQIFKQRLLRAEGQVKMREERAMSLESALDQARAQSRNLERTVQQLNEQNQRLQRDFDEELNKLNQSMEKNTKQLEEIAYAREILQSEKEDYKEKLKDLTNHYNESINKMNGELHQNILKLKDIEKKYNEQLEEKKSLQGKVEFQYAQLAESDLRNKDTLNQLKDTELALNEMIKYKNQYEETKNEIENNKLEIDKIRSSLTDQQEAYQELEQTFLKSQQTEDKLKRDIKSKDEYIKGLEKKQFLLRQKCQENENKMEIYEEQLLTLKNHITNLKEHFGEFENINDLHEMINQQQSQLSKARHENDELSDEIQKKRNELNNLIETISEQEDLIKQRHDVMQMLSEKEEQNANNLHLEINEKNNEIQSLLTNIENKKRHITQLEKIVLTIEDHNRQTSLQRQKDHERIHVLEKRIAQYENYIEHKNREAQPQNLDDLIKILEDEIKSPFDSEEIAYTKKNKIRHDNTYKHGHDLQELLCKSSDKIIPTKIVMGNFVKKTYVSNNDKHKDDNLDRKQAITNIDTQKWITNIDANNQFPVPPFINDNFFRANEINSSNLQTDTSLKCHLYTAPDQTRIEKKSKMFKFAGHRI